MPLDLRLASLALLWAPCLLSACDPALVLYAPEQRERVAMTLFPTSGRQGREVTLIALPQISSFSENDVLGYDLGPGIEAPTFDTGAGRGCKQEAVVQLLDLLGEGYEERFPICFLAHIAPDAPLGSREVSLALATDGVPLFAQDRFTVFPSIATDDADPQVEP